MANGSEKQSTHQASSTMPGRIARWAGLTVLILLATVCVVLAITGLPKPSAIRVKHVSRVTWKSGAATVAAIREVGASMGSDGWLTDPSKLWVVSGPRLRQKRTLFANAGSPGEVVQDIPPAATSAVGSPDTKHPLVAYLLDEGGSELYRLFIWSPGGPPRALTSSPEKLELCCMNSTGSLVAFSRNSKQNGLSDVLIANPRDPSSVKVILSGLQGEAAPTEWSPDGQRLLILQNLAFDRSRAYVFDSTTNQLTRIAPEWGDGVNITGGTWSKNGQMVYLTSDAHADFARPFEIDLRTHTIRPLVTDERHDAVDIRRAPGTDILVVLFNENGETMLYRVDPAVNQMKRLQAPTGGFRTFRMHPQEPRLVEVVRQSNGRSLVAVVDIMKDSWQQWAVGDPPGHEPASVGESLTYPTFDLENGKPREIHVIYKVPTAGFASPWPVIIELHGGPADQWRPGWDPIDAIFQRMGVAILKPNVRGSTGYGRAFETLDDREKREDAVRDVGALLDWIKTRPDLDASRVGVLGGSYGGYLSLASMVHYSDRLRCGVDMFGIANFPDILKASEKEFFVDIQRNEYGDERDPKTRAFLEGISPITHADRIAVPILIYQGANDTRVKPEQSRGLVDTLEHQGRQVSYVEANNEGHGLNEPLNQLYVGSAIVDFFRRNLIEARKKP